jgi:glycosyltransferase involved in cell wall biosynthesis
MEPLVSVLIPAYNAQAWLAQTIESVLNQTYKNIELIVVDDGSKDRTAEIGRLFSCERVRICTQRNQGASVARNHAFSLSRGDLIQWLDADDLLDRQKIELQVNAYKESNDPRTLLASAWGTFMYRPRKANFSKSSLWCDLAPEEWLLRKLEEPIYMQTACWLVSRELTEAAGPWNSNLWVDDDGEYFCRVVLKSQKVRFVENSKVFYRVVGASRLSHVGLSQRKMAAHLDSIRLHVEYARSLGDTERIRRACLAYLQRYFIYFYPEAPEKQLEMQQIARTLGAELHPPRLRWKYRWVQQVFGWSNAKKAQLLLPYARQELLRCVDKLLYKIETAR